MIRIQPKVSRYQGIYLVEFLAEGYEWPPTGSSAHSLGKSDESSLKGRLRSHPLSWDSEDDKC
jgi:hypothetical protein